jgi:DNA-binding transcriptional regulator YhcF (GntR family)
MIGIAVNDSDNTPIYQQITDQISRAITLGNLNPGFQLPTVRSLAAETGVSQGTIKHAYDMLEREGFIKKTRGSGTFVNAPKAAGAESAKAQAMQAIDSLLDRMGELSFTPRDIRIFMDLKLREREAQVRSVTVAAVDCSPEALSVMSEQILGLPHTEVYKFLLDDVLNTPKRFDPATDLVVTTATHFEDLTGKMLNGHQPTRLVMAIATTTAVELAAIPPDTRLGIICASRRFAQIMLRACDEYCKLKHPVSVAYFGDGEGPAQVAGKCDRLLLPPNYALFTSPAEEFVIKSGKQSHTIQYRYEVERGSLLYLEEQINKIYQARQRKV